MGTQIEGSSSAHVRWLVAGAFTAAPTGTLRRVSRHDYTEALAAAGLALTVTVPDRLGAGEHRALTLTVDGLPALKLAGVVERVPVLEALRKLGEDLGSADPARRPAADVAVARVIELVGDGRLAAELRAALAPAATAGAGTPAPAAAGPTPVAAGAPAAGAGAPAAGDAGGGALDRIFAQAQTTPGNRGGAASAIGGFVDAVRKNGATGKPTTYAVPSSAARGARRVIEDAVYATAADLLRDPLAAALESAWRGLKLVIDETPREEDVELLVLDALAGSLPAALEAALSADRAEWPDAVFVVDPIDDVDRVEQLAEVMSGYNIPVVVTVAPERFAALADAASSRNPTELMRALDPAWARFRQNELSRWVCACGNPVVLHAEGQGPSKREVLGSPAFALAAMLTASYRDTGLFGKVFGPTGALKTPAVRSFTEGRSEAMIPLERFVPVSVQADLAALGVLALGSGRNTDKAVATAWPTASGSPDAVGLPAQIITGRVVRFALWVRDQIQPGTPAEEIKAVYEQAAGVFLFPGIAEGAFLDASVLPDQNGKPRVVHLDVQVRAALAGSSVQLGFDVPLGG